jgi:membrane dipeptidase
MTPNSLKYSKRQTLTILLNGAISSAFYPLSSYAKTPLSDTHSHLGMSMREANISLREQFAQNDVRLVSWAVVADTPFINRAPDGKVVAKSSAPVQAGEFLNAFKQFSERAIGRVKREGLRLALNSADIDTALAGETRVILSTEGAHYLEGDIKNLDLAFNLGFRQIGLGHFIEGDITDIRTEAPKHNGLTAFGKEVVKKCNEMGVVVDLAHSTDKSVEDALKIATKPLLWSHSSISPFRSDYRSKRDQIMSISKDNATEIAKRGGIIGIWPSLSNYTSIKNYAESLIKLIEWVGEDHLAFGTDMSGLGPMAIFGEGRYEDLKKVSEHLHTLGTPQMTLEKLCFRNYGRLLKDCLKS